MPGMMSDQDIFIRPVGFVKRAVYDLRSEAKWRIQTGYILYGINIAVWRPYDPEDVSLEAEWRRCAWFPIYLTKLSFDPDFDNRSYETHWLNVNDDFRVKLPTTISIITRELKNHLYEIHKAEMDKDEAEGAEWRAEMRLNYGPDFGDVSDD